MAHLQISTGVAAGTWHFADGKISAYVEQYDDPASVDYFWRS